jgi:hypothetical protein
MQLGIRYFAFTYTLRTYVGNINRNYASSGSTASVKFNVQGDSNMTGTICV